jgi:hypothetical protein
MTMPLDQSRAARRSLSMAMAESFVDAVCWWIDRRGAGIMRGGRRVWTGLDALDALTGCGRCRCLERERHIHHVRGFFLLLWLTQKKLDLDLQARPAIPLHSWLLLTGPGWLPVVVPTACDWQPGNMPVA